MKFGIVTQARMGSTRLPGKVLLPAGGVSLLEHHLTRLKESGIDTYVATSDEAVDDVLAKQAIPFATGVYRGSERDVLRRYFDCASAHGIDVIIRVTADCPLIDGALVREAVARYRSLNDDRIYLSNCIQRTYPHGLNFEIFSFRLLDEAHHAATDAFDREHVTPYIIRNGAGDVRFAHVVREGDASRFRITVDTMQDYMVVKTLIEDHDAARLDSEHLIALLERHPELLAINEHVGGHIWGDGTTTI